MMTRVTNMLGMAPRTASGVQTIRGLPYSIGETQLRDRLAAAITPLTQPPFGSAAVVASVGAFATSVALGTLVERGGAAGSETLFNVASVSKLLTAARVVSLAHVKLIGLDDPIAKYL